MTPPVRYYGPRSYRPERNTNNRDRLGHHTKGGPEAFKKGKGGRAGTTRPPHPRGGFCALGDPPIALRTDEGTPKTLPNRVVRGIREGGNDRENDIPPTERGPYPRRYPDRPDDGIRAQRHYLDDTDDRTRGDAVVQRWAVLVRGCGTRNHIFRRGAVAPNPLNLPTNPTRSRWLAGFVLGYIRQLTPRFVDMSTHTFEKHSVRTLAMRFKGLASRNTIVRWLREGKIRPEMTDKTPAPYLFEREVLDAVGKVLETYHDKRVRKMVKNEEKFREVRDRVRRDCIQTLVHNDCAEFSKKPHLVRFESDPALRDDHAIGIKTPSGGKLPSYSLQTCSLGKREDINRK